ncbi:MAG: hypothetical protein JNK18_17835 [Cyclobacteriaceae bacterium]|nr:hypothetical protein [Cyclobacteriaceae bacterium]
MVSHSLEVHDRKKVLNAIAFTLTIAFSAVSIPVKAQEIKYSERYLYAYKKYLNAECPVKNDSIQHFVYFARDRELIENHPLLSNSMFKGAQIMYAWNEFESEKGKYDFSILKHDYEYLKRYGKKLFIQLQDVTFNPQYSALPDYLLTSEYDGGVAMQYNDDGTPGGWVAKRWNKKVRERFASLFKALGEEFNGKIEGINLQETSIGVNDSLFSYSDYINGLKENMLALKMAFPTSTTMIYANFTPGEWLPGNDKGYLRSIYEYGEKIGVGLGGPDLLITRKGQLNHILALMHERQYTVPLGIAVQDGNYIGATGDVTEEEKETTHTNIVPVLHAFAKDFLKVTYMFWSNQEPYFTKDVLPCFRNSN